MVDAAVRSSFVRSFVLFLSFSLSQSNLKLLNSSSRTNEDEGAKEEEEGAKERTKKEHTQVFLSSFFPLFFFVQRFVFLQGGPNLTLNMDQVFAWISLTHSRVFQKKVGLQGGAKVMSHQVCDWVFCSFLLFHPVKPDVKQTASGMMKTETCFQCFCYVTINYCIRGSSMKATTSYQLFLSLSHFSCRHRHFFLSLSLSGTCLEMPPSFFLSFLLLLSFSFLLRRSFVRSFGVAT